MGFYEEFSKYYDSIFPLKSDKVNFLSKNFSASRGNQILDIGTGTGSYAIALAEEGFQVVGIDLDNTMLEMAREKLTGSNLPIEYKCIDMLELENYFKDNTFYGIYTIGNVLVHLESREKINQAINKMSSLLKRDGILIIQIINYDRIVDQHLDGLPTIINKDEGVSFLRKYQLIRGDDRQYINFNTELSINKKDLDIKYENTTQLIPLRSGELYDMLQGAGFNNIKLYGDFKGKDFDIEESIPCIAVAHL